MVFESVVEIYKLKKQFLSARLLIVKKDTFLNSFYVFIHNLGCNEVYIYNLSLSNRSTEEKDAKKNLGEYAGPHWDLSFVTTVFASFPVYFMISTRKIVWAVGEYELMNFNDILHKYEPKSDSQDDWAVFHVSQRDVKTVHVPNISSDEITSNVPKKKLCLAKQIPIRSVSSGVANSFLVCRQDSSNRLWEINIITDNKNSIHFGTVPFPNENVLQGITKFNFGASETYIPELCPVVVCIGVDGVQELEAKEVLTECSFLSFFGPEALHPPRAVILFGLPDGHVLWSFLPVHSVSHVESLASKFHVLCNIEQPVQSMCAYSYDQNTGNNSFLIIGCLGKVVLLSSAVSCGGTVQQNIQVFTSFISSPVCACANINGTFYHTSTDNKLWISYPNRTATDLKPSKIEFTSHLTDVRDVIAVSGFTSFNDLVLCITSNGVLLLGNFKEGDEPVMTTKQIPSLLGVCYEQSHQLQALESTKLKQTLLFSQLSIMMSILDGELLNSSLATKVTKLQDSFLIQISFDSLQKLNLHPDYWYLYGSVSRHSGYHLLSIKKTVPLNPQQLVLCFVADESFSLFSACNSMPWYIEAGLILSVPEEWQKYELLKSISMKFPLYLQMSVGILNVLHLCLEDNSHSSVVGTTNFKHDRNDSYINIQKVLCSKANAKKCDMNLDSTLNDSMFPSEFSFRFCLEDVKKMLMKYEESNNYCSFFKVLSANIDKEGILHKQSMLFLGHPVTVSTCKNGSRFCISVSTSCFKLLVSLKFAVFIMMSCNSKSNASKYMCIAPNMFKKLERLSRKVICLLCDEVKSNNTIREVIDLYRNVRQDISNIFT